MEGNTETVSRPPKLEHVGTILYEIDMLNYCYGRLREQKWADKPDSYLCIEASFFTSTAEVASIQNASERVQ